jgi:hypothetical protein
MCIHTSAMDALCDGLPLRGVALTDRRLDALIEQWTQWLGGEAATKPAADATLDTARVYTLLLDDERPLRMQVSGGQLQIVLRAAIQPVVGNKLPSKEIVIPISATVEDDRIKLLPGAVRVSGVAPAADGAVDLLADNLIRQEVASRLKPIELPRRFTLPLSEAPPVAVRISQIRCESGWLLMAVDF